MQVLNIENLSVSFTQYEKGLKQTELLSVRNMDVEVNEGELAAVVGSSGSGKSLLAHAVMGLLPYNASMGGRITYLGEPLTKERIEKLRGNEIVLVPQSVSYLDPLMKVGSQVRKGKKDEGTKKKLRNIFSRYHLKDEVEEIVKEMPAGCPFAPRCVMCTSECIREWENGIPYRRLREGRVRCLNAV